MRRIYIRMWLTVFMALFLFVASAQAESAQFLKKHLAQIQQQSDYSIGGEVFIGHKLLYEIYSKNQFRLLWHRPDSVKQLFAAIQASSLEGLTPDDYHLKQLRKLQEQRGSGMDYPTLAANFDLLLTDGLIRLAYDKSFGKVDPKYLHSEWNLPEKTIRKDPALAIETAIVSGTVAKTLAALSPVSPIYENLKKALARYRFIAGQGGWPVIPSGPVLKVGSEGGRVSMLRERLFRSGDLSVADRTSPVFDASLKQAVSRFQQHHYLEEDGVVGKQTLAELNTTAEEKVDQIRVNLERARWILRDIPPTVILVDIAGYTLNYYLDHNLIWKTQVVVGQPYHMTPTFGAEIKYLVINPTWTIPRSIIGRETLPRVQKDPQYLSDHNLRVLDYKGNSIDTAGINWQEYTGKSFPYLIRQDPGPQNALGRIKFMFPNKHAIYLHDTPSRGLFARDKRAFSHGCIRVNDPLTLGELLLANDGQDWSRERIEEVITGRKITTIRLQTPVPVLLLYWTVNITEDNKVLFKQDIYGRDKQLLEALDGTFRVRKSVVRQIEG